MNIFSVSQSDLFEQSTSVFGVINILATFPKFMNKHAWESFNVQSFINKTGLHFDVIVAEDFYSESFLMFAHKHKAPIVTICMFSIHQSLTQKNITFLIFNDLKKVHLELRILSSVNRV